MSAKWLIVWSLEALCGLLDKIPYRDPEDGKWYRGAWGCYRFSLAERSARLDERWKTGVWRDTT
jgi:hypothetical protein